MRALAAQQVPRRLGVEEHTETSAVAQAPRRPEAERHKEVGSKQACHSPARESSPPQLPVRHHCGRQTNLTCLHYRRGVCKICAASHHAMHEHLAECEPPADQGLDHGSSGHESFVTPRRRYICLLRAIEMVAGDERLDTGVQRRANATLQAMCKSADCFIAGLAGDYGEACLEFLRYFDVRDHDPARAAGEVDAFV